MIYLINGRRVRLWTSLQNLGWYILNKTNINEGDVVKKKWFLIGIAFIASVLIFYLLIIEPTPSEDVGWDDFVSETKSEFPNVKGIGWANLTNPTISIYISMKKPYKKEEIEAIFLKTIEFLGNGKSYDSLQDRHKDRFKYSADEIIINFEYIKGDDSIYSYYFSYTETGGEDFTFDSFKKWRMNYNGEYLGIYELPEK